MARSSAAMSTDGDFHERLTKTLRRGQQVGIIGGDIADHEAHAMAWIHAIGPLGAAFCVDLGTGAGLPGLALALANPDSGWLLTEARGTRATFVRSAVRQLQLQHQVAVWDRDVQEAAHEADFRGRAELVTARAFGSPGITAECGTAFLRPGGSLVVSEPPGEDDSVSSAARWPPGSLAELGLGPAQLRVATYRFAVMERTDVAVPTIPRRRAAMERAPLF